MFFEILIMLMIYFNLKLGLVNIIGYVAGAEWLWIIGITILVGVIVSVIRVSTKRKKFSSSISSQPNIAPQDNTQFWVCPNCGNNTQMKDERQYCYSCKIYLSI